MSRENCVRCTDSTTQRYILEQVEAGGPLQIPVEFRVPVQLRFQTIQSDFQCCFHYDRPQSTRLDRQGRAPSQLKCSPTP